MNYEGNVCYFTLDAEDLNCQCHSPVIFKVGVLSHLMGPKNHCSSFLFIEMILCNPSGPLNCYIFPS